MILSRNSTNTRWVLDVAGYKSGVETEVVLESPSICSVYSVIRSRTHNPVVREVMIDAVQVE